MLQRPRILYLSTGSVEQAIARNGLSLFTERECSDFDGFFEHVHVVAFPAGRSGRFDLTDRHTLWDVDPSLPALGPSGWPLAKAGRFAAFLLWAVRLIRRERITVVQSSDPYIRGSAAQFLARVCGVPYAIHITRDYDIDHSNSGKLAMNGAIPTRIAEKWLERRVLRGANLIVADRQSYLDYGIANGGRSDRARRNHVIVDRLYYSDPASRIDLRSELAASPGQRLLLYVGRLEPDKHVVDLLSCLAAVRATGIDARLLIAGDGPQRGEIERLARDLEIATHVAVLGSQPLSRLPAIMASTDVILGPHMGYTLVEAALSGTPIVAYDWEWHSELVSNGLTGVLVPFQKPLAMAAAVVELLRDPARARAIGRAGRELALQLHDPARVIARYREIYSELLGH